MYQRILAALDFSEMGTVVFEQALQLAQLTQAQLILLHVLSSDEKGYPTLGLLPTSALDPDIYEAYVAQCQKFEQRGIQQLKLFAKQAQTAGVGVGVIQKFGHPGRMICQVAHRSKIDLIVMGTHGRIGATELLLGSQSNYVMHHARYAVLVVRESIINSDQADIKDAVSSFG
jgi:nucleotide-binding universal stress UspA family protein